MSDSIVYSSALSKNVINIWGKKGKQWLESLSEKLKYLTEHWQLSNLVPVPNMTYNFVALATCKQSQKVVLKLVCNRDDYDKERLALAYFNGSGTISLMDSFDSYQAMLLQQAVPATTLKSAAQKDMGAAIEDYKAVVDALCQSAQTHDNFIHVSAWCDAINRIDTNHIEKKLATKAKAVCEWLLSTANEEYICHGDLHLENIVRSGDEWLAIDPKGVVAEKAFESSAFDWLLGLDSLKHEEAQHALLERINKLASLLGLDANRLLCWVFVKAIISAQWFIEDGGNPDRALTLAKFVYPR